MSIRGLAVYVLFIGNAKQKGYTKGSILEFKQQKLYFF